VSGSRSRMSARDYKSGGNRNSPFDIKQYQQFGAGLAVGLVVALGVFVFDHREKPAVVEKAPQPRTSKDAASDSATAESDDPAEKFDFYDMLPKYEVVVAENERDVRRDLPSAPVEQPGAYVLQVGSYRNLPDAERLRAKLGKQGIDATIQRVAVDADVWHRVRIGPFRDLVKLNATRKELRGADIDVMLIRIGD
jgi:cell division protein FtsN